MNRKICVLLSALLAGGILLLSACGEKESTGDDRETFAEESYAVVGDATVAFCDGLDKGAFSSDPTVGDWIANCSASDRDEHFAVYTLRHEAKRGDATTFTYLVYYPHGGASVTADYEVLEGESGYVVNIRYTPGGSSNGYALSYLSVTLLTEKAPRLRILKDSEVLGQLASVSEEEIPTP